MLKLPEEFQHWIKHKLNENEVVVWAEQPPSKRSTGLIIVLLFFVSFIVMYAIVFSNFFIGIVLLVIMWSLISSFFRRKKAIYMITNFRAIVWSYTQIISYYPDQLINFEAKQKSGARGDIVFASLEGKQKPKHNFINIKSINRVEALLERLANSG